jgi:DNA-binding CsgD family transcriptional regulator
MQLSDDVSMSEAGGRFMIIGRAIDQLLPGDTGGLVHSRPGLDVSIVGNPHSDIGAALTAILGQTLAHHPQVLSYLDDPSDLSPRRISDLLSGSEWSRHQVYRELFVPLGARHQLSMVVKPFTTRGGDGWAVNRSLLDFSDTELEIAARIQPVLSVLHRADALGVMLPPSPVVEHKVGNKKRLTVRESDILVLVSHGFTAVQIGNIRRISPRTVRKHLQNIYDKLDCHDRLMAVRRAQDAGLLPVNDRSRRFA